MFFPSIKRYQDSEGKVGLEGKVVIRRKYGTAKNKRKTTEYRIRHIIDYRELNNRL